MILGFEKSKRNQKRIAWLLGSVGVCVSGADIKLLAIDSSVRCVIYLDRTSDIIAFVRRMNTKWICNPMMGKEMMKIAIAAKHFTAAAFTMTTFFNFESKVLHRNAISIEFLLAVVVLVRVAAVRAQTNLSMTK